MCTRINKMMFIKDGHPSTLESESIQDDVMDKVDKTEVKGKAHCVIKMKAQRVLKLIDYPSLMWMRLDPTSMIVLPLCKGGTGLLFMR